MNVDPDYTSFNIADSQDETTNPQPHLEITAREEVVERIKGILSEQFDKEIEIRENELALINERLTKARHIMDRLRACIVASYYAKSFTKSGAKGPGTGASQHPAIQNVLRRAMTTVMSKNPPPPPMHKQTDANNGALNIEDATVTSNAESTENEVQEDVKPEEKSVMVDEKGETDATAGTSPEEISQKQALGGRLRVKKTIIVGNVSKYIPSDQRESSDKSTHKWMVYVRGDKENPRIDNFVRKVWFFLHPSYRPHDIVEVAESPFHLTRRGWGEFPIRVQIHFCDRRARPVDIIHGLKLDRTYTGLQTLGAETVCEVELDQASIQSSPTDILESELTSIPLEDTGEKKKTESDEVKNQESADTSTGSGVTMTEFDVSASKINHELHTDGIGNSNRKRKNDGSLETETEHSTFSTPHLKQEYPVDTEMSTSVKKTRKRRIDFSPKRTKLMLSPAVSPTNIVHSDKESLKNTTEEAESAISKVTVECETDENITYNDNELKTANTAVTETPFTKPSDPVFRVRSSSVGDNLTKIHTVGLAKSAITVTPAVSVKLAPGTSPISNPTGMKSLSFSIPKSPSDSRPKTKAIVLPVTHKKHDEVNVSKGSVKDTTPRATTIPLSSIFKSGSMQPVKPLVLKVAGTSNRVSPTFSINILNLGTQSSPKAREKRSHSADLAPSPKLTCFKALKSSKHIGLQQSTPITQLHIITPGVKSKSNTQATAISLQDLQNALSSGTIAVTPKLDLGTGDMKVSTKEISKKEEKTQIPPSSQGKETPAVRQQGKKSANSNVKLASDSKQGTVSKLPTIKDPSPASVKPKPIHQAIGDSIIFPSDSNLVIEDLLPRIAMKVPLIMKERDFLRFPFCATSESEFLEWNVGKQRASELKRAILIQDVLKYLIKNHESLKESKLPSKKFIVDWCLKHGYSIFTDEFEEGGDESSNVEGSGKSSDSTSTLASSQSLMKKLELMGKSEEEEDSNVIVDVISVDDAASSSSLRKEQNISRVDVVTDLHEELMSLVSSSEIELVEEQTRQIGIRLHHQDGLPTTHIVLAKALQQFLESLLRKALSKRLTRRDGGSLQRIAPDEIFVQDVVGALNTTDTFDFLTDNHLASDL